VQVTTLAVCLGLTNRVLEDPDRWIAEEDSRWFTETRDSILFDDDGELA
jgi:hypothetical protein